MAKKKIEKFVDKKKKKKKGAGGAASSGRPAEGAAPGREIEP